jgi:hypothetical protein
MMKHLAFIFIAVLTACEVEENTPAVAPVDDFDEAMAMLVKQGTFVGIGGHTASGMASIYENSNGHKVVVLDPYESQNGPDLKVYLSKNVGASSYINLGGLKATIGKQSYAIQGNPSIADYTYVHIWCEKFSVEFARAPLQ